MKQTVVLELRLALPIATLLLLLACQGGRPPGIQEEGFFRTFVWFATDRELSEGTEPEFTGRRGDGSLRYGRVEVSIPDSHKAGHVESPAWHRFFHRDDPSDFVLVLSLDLFPGRSVFLGDLQEQLAEVEENEALVFVHGFNVSFQDAAKRTAQLAYDLHFTGAPILYSWPSQGEVLEYTTDEASVQWTRPHLQEFLQVVVTQLGVSRVHIVAHSMGNRALLGALAEFDRESLPSDAAELRQIILAAPDIDAGVFRQLAEEFRGKAERYTLYTSANDKAIEASRALHEYPRAGGSIVVVEGVDTIDASSVETSFLAHSYFGDSILSDIFALVKSELPPESRFGLRQEDSSEGPYWVFEPGGD